MNTSYTLTEKIKSSLANADRLRIKILTTPINTKVERDLLWFFRIDKIRWILSLDGNDMEPYEIEKILESPFPKKPSQIQLKIFALKKFFDYIHEEWTVNPNPITTDTVKKIYLLACKPYMGKMKGVTDMSTKMVVNALNFLNQGKDHPIVLAGIMHSEFVSARLLEYGNNIVAGLLAYLTLYKNGYDIRGMYSVDMFHKLNIEKYTAFTSKFSVNPGITTWLEYYADGMVQSLEKTLDIIQKITVPHKRSESLVKLSIRQKDLLAQMDKPGTKITNKDYQKMFGVSQITASRDLSKLMNLGLLLSQGRGRSVFYTKA